MSTKLLQSSKSYMFKRSESNSFVNLSRPYIIDLESSNGTFLNKKKIGARRYVELLPRDVLQFGQSSREYVLIQDELAG